MLSFKRQSTYGICFARVGAADPLTVTHRNLSCIRLKFCRTLELDIPVYDWTLIQSLSDLVVRTWKASGLGKRENWIEVKVINILLLEERALRAGEQVSSSIH